MRLLRALLILAALLAACGCRKDDRADGADEPAAALTQAAPDSKVILPQAGTPISAGVLDEAARGVEVSVWGDPALAGMFALLGENYAAMGGGEVRFTPKGRQEQLDALASWPPPDAPDIIVSGDKELTDALLAAQAIDQASLRTFAGDKLCFVSRSGEKWNALSVFDVYLLRFKQLAVGSADSLLGRATDQALISDGAKLRIEDRLAAYPDAADVAAAVLDKKAELAVVFASTAAQTPGLDIKLVFPEDLHEDIRYQAAAAGGKSASPAVIALLGYIAENDGAQLAAGSLGYDNRETALIEEK